MLLGFVIPDGLTWYLDGEKKTLFDAHWKDVSYCSFKIFIWSVMMWALVQHVSGRLLNHSLPVQVQGSAQINCLSHVMPEVWTLWEMMNFYF